MKTPREVLMDSSAPLSSKADAIRARAIRDGLGGLQGAAPNTRHPAAPAAWLHRWIVEWFRPYKLAWGSLAALWAGTLILTLMTRPLATPVLLAKRQALPEVILAVINSRKALADAMALGERPAPPVPVIKPRTQLSPRDEDPIA